MNKKSISLIICLLAALALSYLAAQNYALVNWSDKAKATVTEVSSSSYFKGTQYKFSYKFQTPDGVTYYGKGNFKARVGQAMWISYLPKYPQINAIRPSYGLYGLIAIFVCLYAFYLFSSSRKNKRFNFFLTAIYAVFSFGIVFCSICLFFKVAGHNKQDYYEDKAPGVVQDRLPSTLQLSTPLGNFENGNLVFKANNAFFADSVAGKKHGIYQHDLGADAGSALIQTTPQLIHGVTVKDEWIYLIARHVAAAFPELWRLKPYNGTQEKVAEKVVGPYTIISNYIFYIGPVFKYNILRCGLDGGNEIEITDDPVDQMSICQSGKVYYLRQQLRPSPNVYQCDINGRNRKHIPGITAEKIIAEPGKLWYLSSADGYLHVWNETTKKSEPVVSKKIKAFGFIQDKILLIIGDHFYSCDRNGEYLQRIAPCTNNKDLRFSVYDNTVLQYDNGIKILDINEKKWMPIETYCASQKTKKEQKTESTPYELHGQRGNFENNAPVVLLDEQHSNTLLFSLPQTSFLDMPGIDSTLDFPDTKLYFWKVPWKIYTKAPYARGYQNIRTITSREEMIFFDEIKKNHLPAIRVFEKDPKAKSGGKTYLLAENTSQQFTVMGSTLFYVADYFERNLWSMDIEQNIEDRNSLKSIKLTSDHVALFTISQAGDIYYTTGEPFPAEKKIAIQESLKKKDAVLKYEALRNTGTIFHMLADGSHKQELTNIKACRIIADQTSLWFISQKNKFLYRRSKETKSVRAVIHRPVQAFGFLEKNDEKRTPKELVLMIENRFYLSDPDGGNLKEIAPCAHTENDRFSIVKNKIYQMVDLKIDQIDPKSKTPKWIRIAQKAQK